MKTRHWPLLAYVLWLAACGSAPEIGPPPQTNTATQRQTQSGAVIGFDHRYNSHAWLGIPYAAAPVGNLRWRAPRPATAWEAPLAALQFGTPCPQIGSPLGGAGEPGANVGSEDCLYLNVYAPRLSANDAAKAQLPVMLWIHGGGNTIGHGGFYDGGNLAASQNLIVVTFNYRLGPTGWFYHPALAENATPEDASGNYGTLDAIAALGWIRDNIAAFGGDPNNVTVFGESAGGTNTLSLILSPLAAKLFHRAISQSGGLGFSSLDGGYRPSDDTIPGHPNSSTEVLARLLIKDGKATDRSAAINTIAGMSPTAIADYLRSQDVWTLFSATGASRLLGPDLPAVFQDGAVIRQGDPLALLEDVASHNDVPIILGTNRDEPKIFMAFDPEQVTRVMGIPLWAKDEDAYNQQAHYGALSWKIRGVDEIALRMGATGRPAYAYRWDWDEQGSRFGFVDLSMLLGAAHGLEIPFVFGHFDIGPQSSLLFTEDNAPARIALANAMMSYWAEFAATGDPARGRGMTGTLWLPYSSADNGPKSILLDTDAGGGIRMSNERVSRESLTAEIEREALEPIEKCKLFARTFRFDATDEWAHNTWRQLSNGACAALDRAQLAATR